MEPDLTLEQASGGWVSLVEDDISECDACCSLHHGRRCEVHLRNRRLRFALCAARIPWRYRHCSFASWDPTDVSPERTKRNERHKAILQAWAKDPQGFLGLCGPPGTGKTHMLAAMCWLRVMDSQHEPAPFGNESGPVSYVSGPKIMAELIGERGIARDRLTKYLERTLQPGSLLVFDDFCWRTNGADSEIYRILVDACYDAEFPLLWATNQLPDHLPVDAPTRSRLLSGVTLPFLGDDRRLRR